MRRSHPPSTSPSQSPAMNQPAYARKSADEKPKPAAKPTMRQKDYSITLRYLALFGVIGWLIYSGVETGNRIGQLQREIIALKKPASAELKPSISEPLKSALSPSDRLALTYWMEYQHQIINSFYVQRRGDHYMNAGAALEDRFFTDAQREIAAKSATADSPAPHQSPAAAR